LPPRGTLAAVERIELHAGGCAANTSIALARLGVPTAVLGKVGRDGFGDFLVGALQNDGVDLRGLVRDRDVATSATIVAVSADGERTFLHSPGANAAYTTADVAWPLIESAEILHIAGPFLMPQFIGEEAAAVLQRAKARGLTTTLDTVWDFTGRWLSVLKPCLPWLDYILPSLEEAKQITGRTIPREIAQVFFDHGVGTVGLKLGEAGAYVRTAQGEEVTIPAFAVPVADTLGAGDAWSAGFLCGLLHGWDLEQTTRFANAVGAFCVQALGATRGLRSFDETCALAFGAF
jgi:sugar/nucleoside kinase (ribokinase family)